MPLIVNGDTIPNGMGVVMANGQPLDFIKDQHGNVIWQRSLHWGKWEGTFKGGPRTVKQQGWTIAYHGGKLFSVASPCGEPLHTIGNGSRVCGVTIVVKHVTHADINIIHIPAGSS